MKLPDPIPPAVRQAIYDLAERQCECCGIVVRRNTDLGLHHLRRVKQLHPGEPPNVIDGHEELDDLLALCRECHFADHRDMNGDYWYDPEEKEIYWTTYWSGMEQVA